jgi:hypothetical protein
VQALSQSSTRLEKSPQNEALLPGGGYKHYKPLGKLDRKVLSLVYEQSLRSSKTGIFPRQSSSEKSFLLRKWLHLSIPRRNASHV